MYRTIFKVFLISACCAAVMYAIRFLIIEPDEMAKACLRFSVGWQCKLRDVTIYGFSRQLYGPMSMIFAVLAAIGGIRLFAVAAMFFGMAGVVLYDFDVAAFGLLLGAVLYLRLSYGQGGQSQQHAQAAPQ